MNVVRETINLFARYRATEVKADYSDFDAWKKELLSLGFTEEEIKKISNIINFNRAMEAYQAFKRQQEELAQEQAQEAIEVTDEDIRKAELEEQKRARIAAEQTHLLRKEQDPQSQKARTVLVSRASVARYERPRKRR